MELCLLYILFVVLNVFIPNSWVVVFEPSCCKLPRLFQVLSHQYSCSDVEPEASVITYNAHTKSNVSALDYIQILCHEYSTNGFGPSVICARTLVSMKFRDYLPHSEIGHVFLSIPPLTPAFQSARRTILSPASVHFHTNRERSVQNASI
jgi:hypothetical protein